MASYLSNITLPAPGFMEPAPTAAPHGSDWLFELKMDGYRLMMRKAGVDMRVYSRPRRRLTKRFPRLIAAMKRLQDFRPARW